MPGPAKPRMRRFWAPVRSLASARWLRQPGLLLRRSFREFLDDHCQQMAAAISYHLLFSLFPLAIAAIGVLGLITQDPNAREAVTNAVLRAVPLTSDGSKQLKGVLQNLSSIGGLGLIGLAGLIWSASGVMAALRTALNVAWDTDAKRPFVRGKIVDLILVAGVFAVIGAALGITLLASILRHGTLPGPLRVLQPVVGPTATTIAFLAATALLFATFLFLFRVVPAVPTRLAGIWPGALTAAVGFEAVQYGFSLYIAYFAHYEKVYGTLGGIIAFLFFLYLASSALLFGAEVASEYPRLRAGQERGRPMTTSTGDDHSPARPDGGRRDHRPGSRRPGGGSRARP